MSFTASSSEDLEAGTTWFSPEEQDLELFCRSVPKVELHIHLDGCFDPQDLWAYLQLNPHLLQCFPVEKKLPWEKKDAPAARIQDSVAKCSTALDYRRLCTCRRRYRRLRHGQEPRRSMQRVKGSLEDMLLCFEFFTPLVYDNFALLEHLACDFVRRQYEQNVIYSEVRYSPQLLASDPRLAHAAITKGLRRGCQEFPNVIVNQLLCGINFCPQWAPDVVNMAIEFRDDFPCAVVGIDVAAGEDHFHPESPFHKDHFAMCQKAAQHGIPITLHAGEVPESMDNVPKAILKYGAKRIGHGYAVVRDLETMELIKAKQIHFEACPSSSVETGGWIKTDWKDHPANVLRSNAIKVSLSSDDPAVFNTSLTWQWRIALKKMGWNKDDVLQVLQDSIDASFAPESQKEKVRNRLQQEYNSRNERSGRLMEVNYPDFRDRVHYDS
ncbi:adenosine deaminase [Nitzschia inconspicua]|uniref:Adenosine deaminase n=1 Tax=Nitzschia inconspicua TaxID=303405 RepID=A0A9K3LNR2_9STRA|nr:adenosine deaminase [Nitzschia inconspicua]